MIKHVERLSSTGNPPRKNEIVALIPSKFNGNPHQQLQRRYIHTFILSNNVANTRESINTIVKQKLELRANEPGACLRNQGHRNQPNRVCSVENQRLSYSTTVPGYYKCTIRLSDISDAVFVCSLNFQGRRIRNENDIHRVLNVGHCKYSADAEVVVGVERSANPNPPLQNNEQFIINHLFTAPIPRNSPEGQNKKYVCFWSP